MNFQVSSALILIKSIVNVLCQCLYIVNQGCFRVDTDLNDCESALPVLESRSVVNQGQ